MGPVSPVHDQHSERSAEGGERAALGGVGNGKPRAAVSIEDVARQAQVSIATVSRVVNNPKLVSPKTAEKVQAVIDRLGYVPNAFAQGLSKRTSKVLGIALPDIYGEFYSELLRGADAAAAVAGYHLLVSSEAHGQRERQRPNSLAFGLIDGIALMLAEPNEDLWAQARESVVPTVVLDTDVEEHGLDSVLVDNAGGTRQAVEHLLQGGDAGRTYFVGGPQTNYDSQARARAFQATLRQHGYANGHDQVSFGAYALDFGRVWAQRMHAQGRLKGAAVLAANDEIALGVMQTAQEHGLHVPRDVRVVGFDDTRLAQLVRPALSSVHVPMAEVGAAAIRLLVRRIDQRDAAAECVRLPTDLVVRESSRV